MANTVTTAVNLMTALSQLAPTTLVSWFNHGSAYDKQELATLQAELTAYKISKAGNVKAQALIPGADAAVGQLQAAISGGSAQEIMAAANAAAQAVNAVGAA